MRRKKKVNKIRGIQKENTKQNYGEKEWEWVKEKWKNRKTRQLEKWKILQAKNRKWREKLMRRDEKE